MSHQRYNHAPISNRQAISAQWPMETTNEPRIIPAKRKSKAKLIFVSGMVAQQPQRYYESVAVGLSISFGLVLVYLFASIL